MAEFPEIEAAGVKRILNCLPSPQRALAGAPRFALPGPVSEIRPFDFRPPWLTIKDQGPYGACVGHGSARGLEAMRALNGQDGSGLDWQELSAWDLYARMCGGVDRGANINDALGILKADGIALNSAVPYGTIDPRRIPASARAQRPRFRVELGELLTSFEEIAWACAEGFAVVYSVHAYGGFTGVDQFGVPNYAPGPADHCVVAYGAGKRDRSGRLLLSSDNSWSAAWGDSGRFWLCENMIQVQSYFEAWIVYASWDDPLAGDNPPPAPVA